jgi:hypothetical protein
MHFTRIGRLAGGVVGSFVPVGLLWEILWLLKNSLNRNLQKSDRVRKPYKRFFSVFWTFSIARFSTFFRKTEFFNSHSSSHHVSQIATFALWVEY